MKKDSKKKRVIALIGIFVILLAVFLIAFAIIYTMETNSMDNPSAPVSGDKEQMITDCITLRCPAESQSIYAGSKNSDKYYECSCGYAKTILPANLVCFVSDEDAIADGKEKVEC